MMCRELRVVCAIFWSKICVCAMFLRFSIFVLLLLLLPLLTDADADAERSSEGNVFLKFDYFFPEN